MTIAYCWPKFGDGWIWRGTGFGNRLFPWARCRIYAHLHGAQMISPIWVRPAVGQLFRGGVDLRAYMRQLVLWGLFNRRVGDLGVLRGLVKMQRLAIMQGPEDPRDLVIPPDVRSDYVIHFQGLGQYFWPLQGWSDYLRAELCQIMAPRFRLIVDEYPVVPIVMCIRCGNDYDPCPLDRTVLNPGEKTPVQWFKRCLELIRNTLGSPVPAFIVSDGTAVQLSELLVQDNVQLVRPGSAISDLMVMSKGRVLLASGSSSFAAWGAFLGQMSTASHPGQPMTKEFNLVAERGQFIGEFDPDRPDPIFLDQCLHNLLDQRLT